MKFVTSSRRLDLPQGTCPRTPSETPVRVGRVGENRPYGELAWAGSALTPYRNRLRSCAGLSCPRPWSLPCRYAFVIWPHFWVCSKNSTPPLPRHVPQPRSARCHASGDWPRKRMVSGDSGGCVASERILRRREKGLAMVTSSCFIGKPEDIHKTENRLQSNELSLSEGRQILSLNM